MPEIPDALSFGVRPAPENEVRATGYDTGAVPGAMKALGGDITQLGDAVQVKAHQDDMLQAQDLENQVRNKARDLMYDPDKGLLNLQGKDAIGVTAKTKDAMKQITDDTLAQASSNPLVQRMLTRSLGGVMSGITETAMRHEDDQRKVYQAGMGQSQYEGALNSAAMDYNNVPAFMKTYVPLAVEGAVTAAKTKGVYEPGTTEINASTGVYVSNIKARMDTGDPEQIVQANQLYQQGIKDGKINYKGVAELGNIMKEAAPKAQAQVAYNKMIASPDAEMIPSDVFYKNGMLMTESGGQQFDPKSSTRTPLLGPVIPGKDERATGMAQVLPSTAKETALKHGMEWDPYKFIANPEYNSQIGQAYFNDQREKYGSNTLAAIAYDWGPGNVDDHIKKIGDPSKGEVSYDKFINTIPSVEAREYVGKTMGYLGGPKVIPQDTIDAHAAKLPALTQPYFVAQAEAHNAAQVQQWSDGRSQAIAAVQTSLSQNGGNIAAVPPEAQQAAQKYGVWEQLQASRGTSAPSLKAEIGAMTTEQKQALDLSDPKIQMGLSAVDYAKIQNEQTDLKTDPAKHAVGKLVDSAMSYALQTDTGMSSSALADLKERRATGDHPNADMFDRVSRLRAEVNQGVADYQAANKGAYPDQNAVNKITDDILMNRANPANPTQRTYPTKDMTSGSHWYNPLSWASKSQAVEKNTADLQLSDIPDDVRSVIEGTLRTSGKNVNPNTVLDTYRKTIDYIRAPRGQ